MKILIDENITQNKISVILVKNISAMKILIDEDIN